MSSVSRGASRPFCFSRPALRLVPVQAAVAWAVCAAGSGAWAQAAPQEDAARPDGSLSAVTVKEQADTGGITEGSNSYTTRSMSTATRLNLSPRQTPQSVSVVTRQQIDDQNIQSLEDLTNIATGLTLNKGATERASFYSRGFQISAFAQDGLPMSSSADTLGFSTLAIYDHVEILRGAAGLAIGAGNPGGALNLVRKRPTRDTRVSVTGSAGRWNNYRTEVDASGALNAAGTVRGRAVIAAQDTDTFITNYSQRRALAYGTVDVDLGPDTIASVGFHYNQEKNPGSTWYGLPTARDGSFLPLSRSTSNAPDWAYWNKTNTRLFAEVEHHFANEWKGRFAVQALTDKADSVLTGIARQPNSELFTLTPANSFPYDRDQHAFDATLSGPFTLFGRRHEVAFGATRRTYDTNDLGYRAPGYSYGFDPVNWNASLPPRPDISQFYYGQQSRTRQNAIYATTRLQVADPLAVIAGVRSDWYDYEAVNVVTNATTASYKVVREVTPYLGAVLDLDDTYSLYGSWTSVFNPQSAVDANGVLLDPVTGINMEAGVKAAYLGGALNASAAVFRVKQQNLATALPVTLCRFSLSCSEAAGEVQSEGFELEASGALRPDWQISAGYTYNTAKYSKDTGSNQAGTRYATERPTRLLRFSTSYRLPGALSDWRVGAAVRAQNEITRPTAAIRQGGYAIVDLMASWQATRQLDLRLNVYNLLDKTYYQAISAIDSGNAFGTPRNVVVTARYRF